jgi:hypothetical protein
MTKYILTCLAVANSLAGFSQNPQKKSLEVPELQEVNIKVNGVLDEAEWAQSAHINELDQYFPEPAAPATGIESDVRIFYTQEGIYFAGVLKDDRAPILSQLTPRDRVNANTDWIHLIINPFNDGANDFNFYLSAAGVQGDSRQTSDNDEDGSWNAVWWSAVVKQEHQWSFEIYIPYQVLRIPQGGAGAQPPAWGFNIKRSIRSDRTMYSWNPIDRNFNNESLQSGLLTGINVIDPPVRISLRPNITGGLQKTGDSDWRATRTGGADIKIGLNKSFTLDMTLLPDFSQVAFDEQFVNFDAFEQQFDENRQFFTEGVNLFNKAGLFYSRRIGGNPKNFTNANLDDLSNTTQSFTRMLNATKLTGTTDRNLSVGFLNAITAANFIKGTDSLGNAVEILTEPLTNYNVTAVDQRFGGNSSIGLINTNVTRMNTEGSARDANVTAITGNLNFWENSHYFNGAFGRSSIYDTDENYAGLAGAWDMGKQTGAWRWDHSLEVLSNSFDPNDLGFQARGNKFHQRFRVSHNLLAPNKYFLRRRHRVGIQYNRLFEGGDFERFHVEYSFFGLTKSFIAFGYNVEARPDEYDFYDARVWGRYRVNPASFWHNAWLSTDFRKPLALELRGGQWWWADWGARGRYGEAEIIGRISDQFNLRAEFEVGNNHQIGWAQTISADSVGMALRHRRNFEQTLRGQYLFGPNSYLTLDLRHSWNRIDNENIFHLEQDGSLITSDAYSDPTLRINFFNVDLKYVLWFAPGRELNLLYRASLANSDDAIDLGYLQNIQSLSNLPADNFFSLRLVYFLDYAQIKKSATLR